MFLPFMVLPILQPTISAEISIEYLRLVMNKSPGGGKWSGIWREESQFLLNRYYKYKLAFLCCLPLCSLYANDHIILTLQYITEYYKQKLLKNMSTTKKEHTLKLFFSKIRIIGLFKFKKFKFKKKIVNII